MMASRESDCELLEMLRLRCRGVRIVEIATRFGITAKNAGLRINAVRKADADHDSNDFDAEAYW